MRPNPGLAGPLNCPLHLLAPLRPPCVLERHPCYPSPLARAPSSGLWGHPLAMRRAPPTQPAARPTAAPLPAFPSRLNASVQPLNALKHISAAASATPSLPAPLRPHYRSVFTTATAADAPPSSSAGDSGGPTSPPPADIEATCLRCVISGTTGDVADSLSDVLLSFGAQSVV